MSEEGWQIVIELFVNHFKVVLKVRAKVLNIVKDLLEVLFYHCKDSSELNVPQT